LTHKINVALKSGTNKFHGEAYFYDRDKKRTANNFFSNRAGIGRADRKYNRYGGMVNGPIFKDRTFFIFTYENQKDNIGEPTTFRVPTALQRTGDFSEILSSTPIFDPATGVLTSGVVNRTAFTGNLIPAARLNAAAVKYLSYFPLPNQPVVNGIGAYFSNMNLIRPYQSYLGKVDHNFNSNNKIFGRYYYSKSEEDRYNWLGKADSPTRGFEYRVNKGLGLNYTSTLSSNFILDVRGSYTQFSQERRNAKPISPTELGLSSAFISSTRGASVIPRFDFTSFNTASIPNAIGSNRSDYNEGLLRPFKVITFQPTMTQIAGDHTLRYGYDFRKLLETFNSNGFNSGRFLFDGTYTAPASNSSTALRAAYGRDLAAFLLGIPTANGNSLIDNPTVYDVNSQYHAVFFQDDWRVTDKLTVNLGLRYELESGVIDSDNRLVRGFDTVSANPLQSAAQTNFTALPPASVPTTFNVLGGLLFSDSNTRANQATDKNNFQPRIGVSYAVDDKTVIRGGYGVFIAPFQIQTPNQSGFSTPTLFVPSVDNGLTFVATLNNPFPTGVAASPGASQGLGTFIGRDLSISNFERKNALYHRFTVGVQRELPWKLGFDATYVFSRGTNLATTKNINSIPIQYLNNGADFSTTVSTFLGANVSNPFRGLVPSNATYNAATIARRFLLVPFPEFGNVNITDYNGRSNYNSLQLQIVKRFNSGLSLNGSYTYTNEHETVNYLNPQDADPTESIASNERPNRFTFSSIYELPIGRGRAFGKNWNQWVDAFIGGWQVQTNYEWQSGEPLIFGNVYFNGDYKDLKSQLGKKDSDGRRYGIDIPAFDITRFYPAGTIINGTAPASIGVGTNTTIAGANTLRYFPLVFNGLRNQRFLNFNAGISKNFKIREKMKLQVRFEAINALNRPYFSGLGLNPATMPNLVTPGSNNLGRFGFANTQRQPPRDFQLGARFTF
jgi:trimeric autotransporter adhesin